MGLKPKELGELFLQNYPVDDNGYSQIAFMDDLIKINPDFKTTNGCQWARSGQSWLGRQFKIDRVLKDRKVHSVQLVGYNNELKNHSIPTKVKTSLSSKNCVILDIGTNIEIDHKNGRYDQENYDENDFQPLTKTANDAKRQHCKECINSKKRYDAKKLGYNISFWKGTETDCFCEGCYWNDPFKFNQMVSIKEIN